MTLWLSIRSIFNIHSILKNNTLWAWKTHININADFTFFITIIKFYQFLLFLLFQKLCNYCIKLYKKQKIQSKVNAKKLVSSYFMRPIWLINIKIPVKSVLHFIVAYFINLVIIYLVKINTMWSRNMKIFLNGMYFIIAKSADELT